MGLSKYIKNKVKEKVGNYQAERAHQREERLTERNEYERGRHEGAFKKGQVEGAGGLTESEKFYARQNRGSGGRVQRTTGRGGFSSSIKNFDNIFGASSFGGGFGGGSESRAPRPNRVITKANGKVRIEEYGGSQHESGGIGLGEGLGGGVMGAGIGLDFGGPPSGRKGKREERHPYEF